MKRRTTLAGAAGILLGSALGLAGSALTAPALAQYDYTCPAGYYYDPADGCVPYGYFTGPPYYTYPDYGFGFFYGGGFGQRWGHAGGHGGGHGGGGFHGGGGHGGGGHGGGGHGGGGHGGGHR
jgi:hypothetical protein